MKITTPCDNYFVLWKQKKVLSYYYVNFSHNLETKIQSWMINLVIIIQTYIHSNDIDGMEMQK